MKYAIALLDNLRECLGQQLRELDVILDAKLDGPLVADAIVDVDRVPVWLFDGPRCDVFSTDQATMRFFGALQALSNAAGSCLGLLVGSYIFAVENGKVEASCIASHNSIVERLRRADSQWASQSVDQSVFVEEVESNFLDSYLKKRRKKVVPVKKPEESIERCILREFRMRKSTLSNADYKEMFPIVMHGVQFVFREQLRDGQVPSAHEVGKVMDRLVASLLN